MKKAEESDQRRVSKLQLFGKMEENEKWKVVGRFLEKNQPGLSNPTAASKGPKKPSLCT